MTPLAPRPDELMGEHSMTEPRALAGAERRAVIAVAVAVGLLGLIGFANSFAKVAKAALPTFGALAPTVPLGIDLGVAAFSAIDIVLARLDMRPRWVRLIPWALTAVTVYLNVTGEPSWFARIAHGVFPLLWVAAVELGAHVVRRWTRLTEGTAMDRVRISRWLLAPARTAGLWRRMILWEIRSYPDALSRERARLLALTGLQDAYGSLAWRWKAPRRVRALYRLGELVPAPVSTPVAATAPAIESVPEPAPVSATGPLPVPPPRAPRERSRRAPAKRSRTTVTAGDAETEFMSELAAGVVPSLRQIRSRLHVGPERAKVLLAHLEDLERVTASTT
jgi:hypothetical protein